MARPIWKGFVSFGLVSIPCSLASMEASEADIDFTMLDRRDHARIRYQRINERTGKEVPWKEIVKGFEVAENEYVIVTPADLKNAAPKATKTIEITEFVEREQIDPSFFVRPYLLQPSAEGERGYGLLREALTESERVGIAKIVLHTRQHLAALLPHEGALMLNTLRFADEIRAVKDFELPAEAIAVPKGRKREVDMAKTLIEGMTVEWKPAKHHDEYRETLRKWIAQRAKKGGQKPIEEEEDVEVPGPYNMMELLKKSIEGQKRERSASRARRKTG